MVENLTIQFMQKKWKFKEIGTIYGHYFTFQKNIMEFFTLIEKLLKSLFQHSLNQYFIIFLIRKNI